MASDEPDLAATAQLLDDVFPGTRLGRVDYLRWLYVDSPSGPVLETNLDDEQGRAGHYAVVPVELTIDGTPRRGALSLNTAVHKRARGRGTFARLAEATFATAAESGVDTVIGVANANSTGGFVRRLGFSLVSPLPADVVLPAPGRGVPVQTGPVDAAFSPGGAAADLAPLLRPVGAGLARAWSPDTLRWRLTAPGSDYLLHRTEHALMVSKSERRHGVNVAVLLKVLAARPVESIVQRALVRAACRAHRAPFALHVGWNPWVAFRGIPLPERLRESPLNFIHRDLASSTPAPSVSHFELLDFDAY